MNRYYVKLLLVLSLHVLVWEEDGEELPMSISAQVMTVPVDGVKTPTLVLAFVVWSVMVILALLQNFSTNGTSYQRVCGRARGKDGQLLLTDASRTDNRWLQC